MLIIVTRHLDVMQKLFNEIEKSTLYYYCTDIPMQY